MALVVLYWPGQSGDEDVNYHENDANLLFFQAIHLLCGSFFLGVRSDSSKMLGWMDTKTVFSHMCLNILIL